MTRYLLTIDWKAGIRTGFSHFDLKAQTITEAMTEAQNYMTDDVYLMTIAEKTGKQYRSEGVKTYDYTEVLTNRGHGWNTGDCQSVWSRFSIPGLIWYEVKAINA